MRLVCREKRYRFNLQTFIEAREESSITEDGIRYEIVCACTPWGKCMAAGFLPMAMLYRDSTGTRDTEWAKFQRFWARPASVNLKFRKHLFSKEMV
jgi:hypothetical protein